MSDTHLDHWSSDDLEADADDAKRPNAAPIPTDDHTCRPGEAAPIDAVAGSTRPLPHPDRKPVGIMANCESQVETTITSVNDAVCGTISAGGAGCALDMTNERDRGLVRQALKARPRRWAGVTDEVKAAVVAGLQKAMHTATVHIDNGVDALDAAKVMASVAKTFEALEAQCQKDEHRAEDHARIDGGQATQAIKLYGQAAPVDAV